MDLTNSLDMLGLGTMSTAYLLWVIVFSSIGLGFFIYGKKQKRYSALIVGILLMVYPMFVSNTYALVLTGIALILVPYFI